MSIRTSVIRGMQAAALWLFAVSALAAASPPVSAFFGSGTAFDPAVPRPDAFFGHAPGQRAARVERITAYLRAVAEHSARVRLTSLGRSYEGREIVLLAVSSPENLARLEEIRARRLARIAQGTAAAEPVGEPLIIWLNYGVHGAEASGLEAVVPTAYYLAAAQSEEVRQWLDKAVILLVAPFNPDGHARRVDHVERWSAAVPNPDPNHILNDLWIEARTNHYGFDLNRQWLLLTQREARLWQAAWQRWRPHVSADFHEMGRTASYYFHPGVPTRRNPLIPEALRDFANRIADAHRAALDATGRLYYSEESFDNFYPGKGSTYPQLNGSVGFLFEAGTAHGGVVETPEGLRRLADNVRTHFLTSLSTIRGAVALKEELLAYERTFARETAALARADAVKADLISGADPRLMADFAALLLAHGIRVHRLARDVGIDGFTFPQGEALIIPRAQPQYRMVRSLFERVRSSTDSVFYDVSAWTLPDAFGLNHGRLTGRRFDEDLLGEAVTDAASLLPEPAPPPADAYGYLIDWRDLAAAQAAWRLLDARLELYAATKPFTAALMDGRHQGFAAGSLFLPARGRQEGRKKAYRLLAELSRDLKLPVAAVATGHTPDEGRDFGSRASFAPLTRPRVVLAVGDGLARYEWGAVWFLLDRLLGMPVTLMRLSGIPRRDLEPYTHIVLVGGPNVQISEETEKTLERFLRRGGTLVAFREQAVWAAGRWLLKADGRSSAAGGAGAEAAEARGGKDQAAKSTEPPPRRAYADLARWQAERQIGGAIFESLIDNTHPLAFGYLRPRIASMKATSGVLPAPRQPFAAVAVYDPKDPLISGFAAQEHIARIAGTPMLLADGLGRGRLVLFADEPTFRASFRGTERLFVNSLFFSSLIAVPRID